MLFRLPGRPAYTRQWFLFAVIFVLRNVTSSFIEAAGEGCLNIFCHLSFFSTFSLSRGDVPIETEIPFQRALKPKTTNQPVVFSSVL